MLKEKSNVVALGNTSRVKHSNPKKILVLHGPNLNLLGTREPETYGRDTLAEINRRLIATGKSAGATVLCFQSNHEGALIDRVQSASSPEQMAAFVVLLRAKGETPAEIAGMAKAMDEMSVRVETPYDVGT